MEDFEGSTAATKYEETKIRPGDTKIEVTFTCTEAGLNSDDIADIVSITARTEDGITDTELIDNYSRTGNVITLLVNYPTTNGAGTYQVWMVFDLGSGKHQTFVTEKIIAEA